MKKTKLKKKIWIISSITLVAYIFLLATNPTAWLTLLPIIIPTGILTVGIPAYAIMKHTQESLENLSNQSSDFEKNNTNINEQSIKKITTDKPIIQINEFSEPQYEREVNKEKKKIKTKGTILM